MAWSKVDRPRRLSFMSPHENGEDIADEIVLRDGVIIGSLDLPLTAEGLRLARAAQVASRAP